MDSKKDIIMPLAAAVVLIIILVVFTVLNKGDNAELSVDTIEVNNEQTMSKLEIVDTVVGGGAEAQNGNRVFVHYTGRFEDGKLFDTSVEEVAKAEGVYNPDRDYSSGFAFILGAGQVIAGWDQGVLGMKVGGKRTLTIPSDLAYGPNDYGPIPGGSTLVFDVELLEVMEGTPDLP